MTRTAPRIAQAAAAAALLVAAREAHAAPGAVPIDTVAPGAIKINGVINDWTAAMTPLSQKVSGNPGSGDDLTVRAGLASDDDALYVGADVTDDKLARTASYGAGEDRLTLAIAFPTEGGGYTLFEVDLLPGDPGNVAGAVMMKGGGKIASATIVEAPRADKKGYTFEAKIPWSAFPPAAKTRVGLRGALRYQDSDGGGPKGVVGTSSETHAGKMPRLVTDSERGIEEAFAHEKGLSGAPQHDIIADVSGDEQRERVLLWDKYVLVAGPHFKDGKQFFFSDTGLSASQLPSFEVRDLTGDGKAEIVMKKRKGSSTAFKETLEIFSVSNEGLTPVFLAEIGAQTDAGSIANSVKVEPKHIELSLGSGSGLSSASFNGTPDGGFEAMLLPWGTVKSRTYKYEGGKFTKVKEESKPAGDSGAGKAPSGPPEPPQPPPPRPPTADEMQEQVLNLYKKDRKVGAKDKPRFDIATNVAEDSQNERILVFGKDLVVFGKGFLKGQGYITIGVGLADPRDVADVTTRDLTGDGLAEIIVRGVQRLDAPKDLGTGKVEREVLLVYSVQGGKLVRVFAAETGLALGDKRISSTIGFLPGQKGTELQLGPGHAVGWEKKTYPYKQDTDPVGGLEPLVLPWTDAGVRYRFNGSAFAR